MDQKLADYRFALKSAVDKFNLEKALAYINENFTNCPLTVDELKEAIQAVADYAFDKAEASWEARGEIAPTMISSPFGVTLVVMDYADKLPVARFVLECN